MRRIEACLDEILAFRLRDERLQFGSGEGVDQASLRDDEKEDLCSGEGGKFVCLKKTRGGMSKKKKKKGRVIGRGRMGPTFFMMPGESDEEEGEDERRRGDRPAFLFENVMCRLDLS